MSQAFEREDGTPPPGWQNYQKFCTTCGEKMEDYERRVPYSRAYNGETGEEGWQVRRRCPARLLGFHNPHEEFTIREFKRKPRRK